MCSRRAPTQPPLTYRASQAPQSPYKAFIGRSATQKLAFLPVDERISVLDNFFWVERASKSSLSGFRKKMRVSRTPNKITVAFSGGSRMSAQESIKHLSVTILWTVRNETSLLSSAELTHLGNCPDCLLALGVCLTSGDIEDAARRLQRF